MRYAIAFQIPPYYNIATTLQIALQDIIIIYLSFIQLHELMSTCTLIFLKLSVKSGVPQGTVLQQCRRKSRLALFYKAIRSAIAFQIPPYYNTTNSLKRHHNHLSFIYPSP